MKKKIFYWSPCLNPVGTVKSTLNSAVSAVQYGSNLFDVTLINACGEWLFVNWYACDLGKVVYK